VANSYGKPDIWQGSMSGAISGRSYIHASIHSMHICIMQSRMHACIIYVCTVPGKLDCRPLIQTNVF